MPKGTSTSVAEKPAPRRKAASTPSGKGGGKLRPTTAGRSLAVVESPAPMGTSSAYRFSSSSRDEVVRGTDFLSTVGTLACTDGAILMNWFVSPTQVNARLGAIAKLWERYQFKRIRLFYIPCVPATTSGQLIFAYDPDSTDVTPVSYTREQLFALDDNVSGSVFTPIELFVRKLDQNTLYYTGSNSLSSDERTELQGQCYVAYTGPTISSPITFGTVMLEYEVMFKKRTYDASAPTLVPSDTTISGYGAGADVSSYLTQGLLAAGYALLGGAAWNTGFLRTESKGIQIPPSAGLTDTFGTAGGYLGHHFFEVIGALNLVGSEGTPIGAYWNAFVRTAAGALLSYLSWSAGKVVSSKLSNLSTGEVGTTTVNGQNFTSCVVQSTATGTSDYFVGYVSVCNSYSAPVWLDFGVTLSGSVTSTRLRGLNIREVSPDEFIRLATLADNHVTSAGRVETKLSGMPAMATYPLASAADQTGDFVVLPPPFAASAAAPPRVVAPGSTPKFGVVVPPRY